MDKSALRKTLLDRRRSLSPEEWREKSGHLCQQLQSLDLYQAAIRRSDTKVLAYFSTRQEPDLSTLFEVGQFGFPVCEEKTLLWRSWRMGEALNIGSFGIREPLRSASPIVPEQVGLILVPCVGCSPRGFRLGYGGGFYDRMLAQPEWQRIPTIGITFDSGITEDWEPDAWDHQCSIICTEKRLYFSQINTNQ